MTKIRLVKGCCPLDCQDTCVWVAHVENEQVIKVVGASDHPFTRGSLCTKVNDYEARAYAPDRLLHPMKRSGPKGSGEFEQISWEEAIETIGTNFSEIIEEYGPEALMPHKYAGANGVMQGNSLTRLFHKFGATRQDGGLCATAIVNIAIEGHPVGFEFEKIVNSQLIILWGANDLTTSHHHFHFMHKARKQNGARLICIDPRKTRTAKACDQHIAIRPGTDAILAAGIANILIDEGLADLEFAKQAANGLDAYIAAVKPWIPERVAETCGVEVDVIIQLAREYGQAQPATIRSGVGPQQNAHGEEYVQSLSSLAILSGHWKQEGGGLFIFTTPVTQGANASRPDLMPTPEPRSLDMTTLGTILADSNLDPPIKSLMIWGTNPAVVQTNTKLVLQGLAREDLFTVVLEHFMTDTARYADILLPSTTQLEHVEVLGAWGHHYISFNHPAIEPIGETKSHGEVMRMLAKQMGFTDPALQESDEEIATSILPDNIDLEALKEKGWIKNSPSAPRFDDPDKKVNLIGDIRVPDATPKNGKLQLLTPKAHYFLNSSFANMPKQQKGQKRPTLDMHPEDAETRKLLTDQKVIIKNQQGEIEVWLNITETIRPGVVSLPGKWWGSNKEISAVGNLLTPSVWSPGGQPAFNDTFVEVSHS